jgi:DNA-directed RNA polymerase subunit N (RpoN/RPB10)
VALDPRSAEGERIGMSRYCDHLESRIAELETAIEQMLDDMGVDGLCVCQLAKARARVLITPEDPDGLMDLDLARKIVADHR